MVIKKTDGSVPVQTPLPADAVGPPKASGAPSSQLQVRDDVTRTSVSHGDQSAAVPPQNAGAQAAGVVTRLLDHPHFGEPNPDVRPASGPTLVVAEPSRIALQHEVGAELTALLQSLPPVSMQAEALRRLEHELGGFQFLASTHYR